VIDRLNNLTTEPSLQRLSQPLALTPIPPSIQIKGAQHGACYGERIELVFGIMHPLFGTMHPRHRQPTRTELQLLKKENDGLRTEIVRLRRELENREGAVRRLELLLRERLTKIDELTAHVDQLREANKRLDAEAEHWALLRGGML
jgi:hypothetical protein